MAARIVAGIGLVCAACGGGTSSSLVGGAGGEPLERAPLASSIGTAGIGTAGGEPVIDADLGGQGGREWLSSSGAGGTVTAAGYGGIPVELPVASGAGGEPAVGGGGVAVADAPSAGLGGEPESSSGGASGSVGGSTGTAGSYVSVGGEVGEPLADPTGGSTSSIATAGAAGASGSGPDCTLQTWYLDIDGDGFGYWGDPIEACECPEGYSADPNDYGPGNDHYFPGSGLIYGSKSGWLPSCYMSEEPGGPEMFICDCDLADHPDHEVVPYHEWFQHVVFDPDFYGITIYDVPDCGHQGCRMDPNNPNIRNTSVQSCP